MTGGSCLVEILILGAGREATSVCEDWPIGWTARALVERSTRASDAVRVTGETDTGGTEGVGRTARDARARGRKLVIGTGEAEVCGSRTARAGPVALLARVVSRVDERSRRTRFDTFALTEDETREASRAPELVYSRGDVEARDSASRAFRRAS